jgi:hypothetical protein
VEDKARNQDEAGRADFFFGLYFDPENGGDIFL